MGEQVFDAQWIRNAAREAAEVIREQGLGGGAGLRSIDELPATGEFGEEEAMEILGAWVAAANRHHQFFTPGFIEGLMGGGDDDEDADLPPLELPSGEVVDGVGVVRVPGVKIPDAAAPDARRYAHAFDELLRDLDGTVDGWVFDFASCHTGGNVHPMLAGLAAVVGPGPVCGFQAADGTISWVALTASDVTVDDDVSASIPNAATLPDKPIAVVMGQNTTSAGEFAVLGLRSKRGARLFGTDSAGYLTNVELAPLPCGADLGLTTATAVDANGNQCGDHLVADEACDPADLAPAIAWVRAAADSA